MNTIGIIGAMDIEIEGIKSITNVISVKNIAGMNFALGSLEGKNVVIAQCGVGKVNAAVCTQIMADMYGVDCVINVGVAGGLAKGLEIGNVVISSDVCQHDMDVTGLGYSVGVIPDMETSLFEADEAMIDAARKALMECGIKGMIGRVAGGDVFVCSNELKDKISNTFGACCCEMEGGAIAQVCYLNKLPFVIIRAISDSADDSGSMDYPEFKKLAAENSQRILKVMLSLI